MSGHGVSGIDRLTEDLRLDYADAAQRIYPQGTRLLCSVCGRGQVATVVDVAQYLAEGFPICHGERMRIGDLQPALVG